MGNHLGAQLWAGTLSLHPEGEALPSSSKVGLAGAGGSGAFFTSSGLPGYGELVLMTGDVPSCLLPPWRKSQLCCLGGPGLVPKCLGPLTSISWSTRPQQHQIMSIYHRFSGIGLQCCPNCCGVRMEVVKHPSQVVKHQSILSRLRHLKIREKTQFLLSSVLWDRRRQEGQELEEGHLLHLREPSTTSPQEDEAELTAHVGRGHQQNSPSPGSILPGGTGVVCTPPRPAVVPLPSMGPSLMKGRSLEDQRLFVHPVAWSNRREEGCRGLWTSHTASSAWHENTLWGATTSAHAA